MSIQVEQTLYCHNSADIKQRVALASESILEQVMRPS